MEAIVKQIYTYKSIDGELFENENDCKSYEAKLPRHLKYCLKHKISSEKLLENGVFEIGYTTESSSTEYVPGGFLREGGDVTTWHRSDTVMWVVQGTMTELIFSACNKIKWWREPEKFIRKSKILTQVEFDSL